MTESRANRLLWITIVALLIAGILPGFVSTHRRMAEFRTRIAPGVDVAELHNMAGNPKQIVRRGESLQGPRRSFIVPPLDEHTAIHVYRCEGLPYFNVYVFIDERQGTVIRSEIENLWW